MLVDGPAQPAADFIESTETGTQHTHNQSHVHTKNQKQGYTVKVYVCLPGAWPGPHPETKTC
jgi:hypothetical protein